MNISIYAATLIATFDQRRGVRFRREVRHAYREIARVLSRGDGTRDERVLLT
jgi:hypothetical protein